MIHIVYLEWNGSHCNTTGLLLALIVQWWASHKMCMPLKCSAKRVPSSAVSENCHATTFCDVHPWHGPMDINPHEGRSISVPIPDTKHVIWAALTENYWRVIKGVHPKTRSLGNPTADLSFSISVTQLCNVNISKTCITESVLFQIPACCLVHCFGLG